MKTRILLTGGRGFFGSRLVARLHDRFDFLAPDSRKLDISQPTVVHEAFEQFKPDIVIHAAAVAETGLCDAYPEKAREVNVQGAINVARACDAFGAKLTFISTEQVFNGNGRPGPFSESDQATPNTVYGQTKLDAEAELSGILEALWVLRFTWLFGLPERGCANTPNVVWNAMQSALTGKRRLERTDEFRGLTYVHDAIDRLESTFDLPYGTWHFGSTNGLSRFDAARMVFEVLGLRKRCDELVFPTQGESVRDVRLDTRRLSAHGISFPDTPDALGRCVSDFGYRM